ncbi:MAG: VPLPA-CTERM-specific exosortase XrtD [Pedobacter sp.]
MVTQNRLFAWIRGFLYVTVLILLYKDALNRLVNVDWTREDYSSSGLIPLVVLYLVWEKRRQITKQPSVPSWQGIIPIFVGIALFWLGELSGEFFTLYFSMWLVIAGIFWLELGWEKLRIIRFPIFFSLAMFPLPNYVNTQLTLKLKLLSSQLGVGIIQLWGMSAFREGNVIDLGFTRLQVVDACSGIRYMVPLAAMAILLAYYYNASLWKRLTIVFSSIPISVATNGLRIASVGILYQFFGPQVAEGFFHDFSGWFIFMFSLGLLIAEIWFFKKLLPENNLDISPATSEVPTPICASEPVRPAMAGRFVVALIVLSATVAAANMIDFRQKTPISRPLNDFPLTVGVWHGIIIPMEQMYLDTLKLSDYVIVNFRNEKGKEINFYTAYYASQTKGESIHTPATCLPGSGWNFEESGLTSIQLDSRKENRAIRVNRAFMEKNGQRQLTYYWFPQRGRVPGNILELKFFVFWDAITQHRTDGALVRLVTPVSPSERVEDAEARMQGFVRLAVPILDGYLPGKNIR